MFLSCFEFAKLVGSTPSRILPYRHYHYPDQCLLFFPLMAKEPKRSSLRGIPYQITESLSAQTAVISYNTWKPSNSISEIEGGFRNIPYRKTKRI